MRKLALFVALVLTIESIVPNTVFATEMSDTVIMEQAFDWMATADGADDVVSDGNVSVGDVSDVDVSDDDVSESDISDGDVSEGDAAAQILYNPDDIIVTGAGIAGGVNYRIDNTGKYVSIWVYGRNLNKGTVPVLWQSGKVVTGSVVAFTDDVRGPASMISKDENCYLYKLTKTEDWDSSDLTTMLTVDNATLLTGSLSGTVKELIDVLDMDRITHFYKGILSVDSHVDCSLDKARIYLESSFAKAGDTVTVYNNNYYYETAEVVVASGDKLYVELTKQDPFYHFLCTGQDDYCSVYNTANNESDIAFIDRCPHSSNLSVNPASYDGWRIEDLHDFATVIYKGNTTGEKLLNATQLKNLSTMGAVRVVLLKNGAVENAYTTTFGTTLCEPDEIKAKVFAEIKNGAAPKVTVKETTGKYITLKVNRPAYIAKRIYECAHYKVEVYGEKGKLSEYSRSIDNKDSQDITIDPSDKFYLSGAHDYTICVRIESDYKDENNNPIASGKFTTLNARTKTPYETKLILKENKVKVSQGTDDAIVLAKVNWNKDVLDVYQEITNIQVTKAPAGANLYELEKAFDSHNVSLKKLDWSKIPAGNYTITLYAEAPDGVVPAKATATLTVLPALKTGKIILPSTRYYKDENKVLTIKPKFEAYDYTGAVLPAKYYPAKCTWSINKFIGYEINEGNGTVTVPKTANVDKNIQITATVGDLTITSDYMHIMTQKRQLAQCVVKNKNNTQFKDLSNITGSALYGAQVIVCDADQSIVSATELKYSVKGSSIKVDAEGRVTCTGKTGKSTIIVTDLDGSKSSASCEVNVVADTVSLSVMYESNPVTMSETEENVFKNKSDKQYLFLVADSDHNPVGSIPNAVNYKLTAKTGKFIDIGKMVYSTKGATGLLVYVPKAATDVITLTDLSDKKNPHVVTYQISNPIFENADAQVKCKTKTVTLYTDEKGNTNGNTIFNFEFDRLDSSLRNKKVKFAVNLEKAYANMKTLDRYSESGLVNGYEGVNHEYVTIPSGTYVPGTYDMNLYFQMSEDEDSVAVPVKLVVKKAPKPTAKIIPVYSEDESKGKCAYLTFTKKNARAVDIERAENAMVGKTMVRNHFTNYFIVYSMEGTIYCVPKEGVDLKNIPKEDRVMRVRYFVYDLSGFIHEEYVNVTIDFK